MTSAKVEFAKRMVHDWKTLADALEISTRDREGFAPGRGPESVVEWLVARRRLAQLSEALTAIDRKDLLAVAEKLLQEEMARSHFDPRPSRPDTRLSEERLASCTNLPSRNRAFIGRKAEMEQLSARVAASPLCVVTGLGGMGKTQLVLEFAHRIASTRRVSWRLRAQNEETLAEDYAALAYRLGLPRAELSDVPTACAMAKEALERHDDWLLVFDNAETPASIAPFIPRGGGNVLVTSRNPNWRGIGCDPLQLEPLSVGDATQFLVRCSGDSDPSAASELAEILGRLPLALAQAAAFVEATAESLAGYIGHFRLYSERLLSKPDDFPDTVATTWSIALGNIERTPGASEMMHVAAYLAPDHVPISVFRRAQWFDEPLTLEIALETLRRYSLIHRTADFFSVHRLLQVVVRHGLEAKGKAAATLRVAVTLLSSVMRPGADADAFGGARLIPHALLLADEAEAGSVRTTATADILSGVGSMLMRRGQSAAAVRAHERALRIFETQLASNEPPPFIQESHFGSQFFRHPPDLRLGQQCHSLGIALQMVGDHKRAKETFEREVRFFESQLGPDDAILVDALNQLAESLDATGDAAGAKEAHDRAERIESAALSSENASAVVTALFSAQSRNNRRDTQGEIAMYREALRMAEKVHGSSHHRVAAAAGGLGRALRSEGANTEALAHHERALCIWKDFYGPTHRRVADAECDIARVRVALHDVAGAIVAYERALRLYEALFGPNHPVIATVEESLSDILRKQGQKVAAKTKLERALRIRQQLDDPDVGDTLLMLSIVHHELGDKTSADAALIAMVRDIVRFFERTEGPMHPKTASTLQLLGASLSATGDHTAAVEAYEQAIRIYEHLFGVDHATTATAREEAAAAKAAAAKMTSSIPSAEAET